MRPMNEVRAHPNRGDRLPRSVKDVRTTVRTALAEQRAPGGAKK